MSFPRYPKYKPSGVEWLGDVPEDWDVCALKRIASLKSGDGITGESIDEVGEFPVFGGNGLRGYTSRFTHDGHYVVVGRQGALCGNINYARGKFWASEHAVVAAPLRSVVTGWLGEMLRAMNLNQHSVSAAQPGLSMEFVGNLRTIMPPLDEQTAIAGFLDRETGKIDNRGGRMTVLNDRCTHSDGVRTKHPRLAPGGSREQSQRGIELLQERRTALISAAVTGKIDVRGLPNKEAVA